MIIKTRRKYIYKYRKEFHSDFDGYVAYGIEISSGDYLLGYYPDIFLDEQKAIDFVKMCNKNQIEPGQIQDAIEDALFSEAYIY